MDDFGARYFTSQFGRFMTPDWSASPVLVPYADLGNPQTFNLYSYVANNPINSVDPEGHFRLDFGSHSPHYYDPDDGVLYGEAQDAAAFGAWAEAAQSTETQQQATEQQRVSQSQAVQKPPGVLNVDVLSGANVNPANGLPVVENAASFTVSVKPNASFPSGDITLTASIHFDPERRGGSQGEIGLAASEQNSATAKIGSDTVKGGQSQGVYVRVTPWSATGNFDSHNGNKGQGHLEFKATDSKGNVLATGTLKVWIENHKVDPRARDSFSANPFPTKYTFAAP